MRDLFPGFYQRTDDELSKLWQEGVFVLLSPNAGIESPSSKPQALPNPGAPIGSKPTRTISMIWQTTTTSKPTGHSTHKGRNPSGGSGTFPRCARPVSRPMPTSLHPEAQFAYEQLSVSTMKHKARAMNAYMRASNLAHVPRQIAWNAAKRGIQAIVQPAA
jgi:hypothetical protein